MASKRRFRRRSCESKRAHETDESAQRHIRRLRRINEGGWFYAYRCNFCGRLHVAHDPAVSRRF